MDCTKKSNKFMLILLIHLCLLPFVISFFSIIFKGIFDNIMLLLFIQPLYCFLLPLVIYSSYNKISFKQLIPINPLSFKNTLFIILLSLTVQPLIMVVSALTNFIFNNDVSDLMSSISNEPFILILFLTAVMPAIFEEIIFRGVLLTGYKNINIFKASLITGLFFGIMHLNPHQFFYALLLGILFAYLIHFTGTIFSSMLAHFIINGSQILMVYISKWLIPSEFEKASNTILTFEEKINSLIQVSINSIFFIPVFILLVIQFIKYNKKNNYLYNNKRSSIDSFENKDNKIIDIYFIFIIIIYILFISLLYFN